MAWGAFFCKIYLIEGTLIKASALNLCILQIYVLLRLYRNASEFLK